MDKAISERTRTSLTKKANGLGLSPEKIVAFAKKYGIDTANACLLGSKKPKSGRSQPPTHLHVPNHIARQILDAQDDRQKKKISAAYRKDVVEAGFRFTKWTEYFVDEDTGGTVEIKRYGLVYLD